MARPGPDPDPFEPPASEPKAPLNNDPSIEHEPHIVQDTFEPDPSEWDADAVLAASPDSPESSVDHSVWDEPALSSALAGGMPHDAVTYRRWLQSRIAETTDMTSIVVTIGLATLSGVFAVVGAMFWGMAVWNAAVGMCVLGPLTEEVMKVALPIWVVERRPYLFKTRAQLLICTAASGFVFAAIENILYLHVYVPDPPPWLGPWRWSVCVALHTGCSMIAGIGLARIWSDTMQNLTRPRLWLASPMMITAIIVHSVYNTIAMFVASADWGF